MRRLLAAIAVFMTTLLIAAVALASTGNYRDSFAEPTYGGSDGSIDWSDSPWVEENDDNSPSSGNVQAVVGGGCPDGSCLAIRSGVLELSKVGARRAADLSLFVDATLKFKMNVVLPLLSLSTAELAVEAWNGSTWKELDAYALLLNEGSSSRSISIPASYLAESFQLRYVVSGLLDGHVFLDHVEIVGTMQPSTTTTSTTSTTTTRSTSSSTSSTTTTVPGRTASTSSTTSTTSTTVQFDQTTTTTEPDRSTSTTEGTTSDTDTNGVTVREGTTTTNPGDDSSRDESAAPLARGGPPDDPGVREAAMGIQASYAEGRFGRIGSVEGDVLGVDIDPNYTMAVEVIESSWAYLLVLILLIATAIVSGLDRRRIGVVVSNSG